MRTPYLVVIFLLSLSLMGVASAGDQAEQTSSAPSAQTDSLQPRLSETIPDVASLSRDSGYGLIHPGEIHPNFSDPARVRPYRHSRRESDGDTLCYAIRSYFMAREARDSDVTAPAGYSTCQKASRFGVKDAIEPPAFR